MSRKKKTSKTKPIDSLKHKDKRANIPTEELRDFVKEDENRPEAVLYPRDPSLDPQLVWKGKNEQDQQDLSVPSVPIYIQEKIHPQSIIEDVRRTVPHFRQTGNFWSCIGILEESLLKSNKSKAGAQVYFFASLMI